LSKFCAVAPVALAMTVHVPEAWLASGVADGSYLSIVIPGRAKHGPGIDNHDREYGFPASRRFATRPGITPCVSSNRSTHDIAFSRHVLPELYLKSSRLKNERRRECRVKASPMARLQKKKQAAVTTGAAGSSGIPCAMFDGLYALSSGTGVLAPVRVMRSIIASRQRVSRAAQAPAPGRQDHTISPCASGGSSARLNRAATRHAHRIPHPTFVTTRVHPSAWGRTGAVEHNF
jgi:hypothetical protein